jgi:hypothetical protein
MRRLILLLCIGTTTFTFAQVSGSGTTNTIPMFTPNGTTLGNSNLFQTTTSLGFGTTTPDLAAQGNRTFTIFHPTQASAMEFGSGTTTNGTQVGVFAFVATGTTATGGNKRVAFFDSLVDTSNPNYGGKLRFGTKAPGGSLAMRMFIDSNGNVGIGTVSPTALLHVNGAAKFNGNLTFNSLGQGVHFADGSSLTSANGLGGGGNTIIAGTGLTSQVVGQTQTLGMIACSSGQILVSTGSGYACNNINFTGSNNFTGMQSISVNSGTALTVTNNDVNADTVDIQNQGEGLALRVGTGTNSDILKVDANGVQVQTFLEKIVNDGAGTTQYLLAKFTSANTISTLQLADTTDALGVVITGAGTTGKSLIAFSGVAFCQFDNSNTATVAHFVSVSSTNAGFCHDAGATFPSSGQVLGVVINQDSGSVIPTGTQPVYLFGPSRHGDMNLGTRKARVTSSLGSGANAVAVNWSSAFGDTNYTANCTPAGFVDSYYIQSVTASGITIAANMTSPASVTFHCIAIHD